MLNYRAGHLIIAVVLATGTASAQSIWGTSSPQKTSQVLWCSVTDAASKRAFVSEPTPTNIQGHLPLWNAGKRFLATINARYTLTLQGGDHACGLYSNQAQAFKARALTEALADKHGWRVISVGAY